MALYGTTEEGSSLLSKPTTAAHEAFLARNAEASRLYHEQRRLGTITTEQHGDINASELKSAVYGGLDGIITTFATVTSVAGANLAPIVIVIVGIAHLFADGLSMGLGDALSSKAEIDYNNSERERERWEMEVDMESEISEMVELYEKRGISHEDAEQIWRILAKYPNAFLDVMMVEELHLLPPDEDDNPWRGGVITCLSFMIFGLVPLLPFLLPYLPYITWSYEVQMTLSVIFTVVTLFILGVIKSRFTAMGASWWHEGLVMAGLGSAAAFVSYIIGVVLQVAFDVEIINVIASATKNA